MQKKITFITLSVFMVAIAVHAFSIRDAHALELLSQEGRKAAVEVDKGFRDTAGYAEIQNPVSVVGTFIRAFLGLLGVLFLVLLVYGGYRWMTAQGNEEEVTKAKAIITQATLGLIIILSAYAISYFVIDRLERATLKQTSTDGANK